MGRLALGDLAFFSPCYTGTSVGPHHVVRPVRRPKRKQRPAEQRDRHVQLRALDARIQRSGGRAIRNCREDTHTFQVLQAKNRNLIQIDKAVYLSELQNLTARALDAGDNVGLSVVEVRRRIKLLVGVVLEQERVGVTELGVLGEYQRADLYHLVCRQNGLLGLPVVEECMTPGVISNLRPRRIVKRSVRSGFQLSGVDAFQRAVDLGERCLALLPAPYLTGGAFSSSTRFSKRGVGDAGGSLVCYGLTLRVVDCRNPDTLLRVRGDIEAEAYTLTHELTALSKAAYFVAGESASHSSLCSRLRYALVGQDGFILVNYRLILCLRYTAL